MLSDEEFKVQSSVFLKCFGQDGSLVAAGDIHSALIKLRGQGFLKLANEGLKQTFGAALDITASLAKKCVPQFGRLGSSTLALKVRQRLLATVHTQLM